MFVELTVPLSVAVGATVGATGVEPDDGSSTVVVGVGPGVLPTEGARVGFTVGDNTGTEV